MTASRHDVGAAVALAVLGLAMYSYRAQESASTASEQTLRLAVDLLTVRHGHDEAGRFLPVFVEAGPALWLPPVSPYATWAMTTVKRIDQAGRRSAAVFGAVGVALTYAFALTLFGRRALAWIAGVLLLTNPAYVASARSGAVDGVWIIPPLLISLIAAVGFAETRSRLSLAIAAAALTACVYAQPSGACLALIIGVLLAAGFVHARLFTQRDAVTAAGAAALAAAPIVLWFIIHPTSYVDTLGRWFLHPAYIRRPWSLAIRMMNWFSLADWSSTYWTFFDPTRLLYRDGAPGSAGTFLLPTGVLLVAAGHELVRPRQPRARSESVFLWIVALGFAASPLVPASFGEPDAIQKALSLPLFGTILCAVGIRALWTIRPMWGRVAVGLVLGLAGVQFVLFYKSLVELTV